ncbi:MAG: type II toxin-antitoxin system HicA family toxin [Candidatus Bathyarchaeales archaeon]
MSKKLPTLSWQKLLKVLNKAGFKIVHQKGSHIPNKRKTQQAGLTK